MKYYIIAGEASGDLHASNLMKELRNLDSGAQFRCWGGDLMAQQGGDLARHYRDLAFMGFLEVVSHLPVIAANLRFCKKDLVEWKPDVLILVDYPGFNLRIAKFAHARGIRVFYYISPQLWAWKTSRVKIIRENVDQMFVILPFEKEFYASHGYQVDFVGHPLLDVIRPGIDPGQKEMLLKTFSPEGKPVIALLPGSRKQEIRLMLKAMMQIIPCFPDHRFVVAGAPSIEPDFYRDIIQSLPVGIVFNKTYDLLHCSEAALVTSGTATLETALVNIPQVVCYKGNKLSYMIARKIVHVKYISLVNLVMSREVVKELIQDDLKPDLLFTEMEKILNDSETRDRILRGYQDLRKELGGAGASAKAAGLILGYIRKQ